jgi:hypothetical protein
MKRMGKRVHVEKKRGRELENYTYVTLDDLLKPFSLFLWSPRSLSLADPSLPPPPTPRGTSSK